MLNPRREVDVGVDELAQADGGLVQLGREEQGRDRDVLCVYELQLVLRAETRAARWPHTVTPNERIELTK